MISSLIIYFFGGAILSSFSWGIFSQVIALDQPLMDYEQDYFHCSFVSDGGRD